MYGHPATPHNPKPWVLVSQAGTDDEDIIGDYATHREAVAALLDLHDLYDEGADIMRRRDDGTLTTEF